MEKGKCNLGKKTKAKKWEKNDGDNDL